jgi:predicted MFS family arabinose efflux permease
MAATADRSYGEVARSGRLWCLAIAETIVWAGTYYLFPALLAWWEADLGWSKTDLTAGATGALIVAALTAPYAGRLIDRGRGRLVLAGGAAASALLLLALAFAETRTQFFGLWLALGVAMACALYEPCFAFLTRTRGVDARRAITLVTLVAGFAGTLSFPLANAVAEAWGWRAAVLTFAGLIGFVAVPLFWVGAAGGEAPPASGGGLSRAGALRIALRHPAFWFLAAAFALLYLNHGMVVTHLLPLLHEREIPLAYAVLTASMIGPMQVAGRLAMMAVERWLSMNAITVATFASITIATACLYGASVEPALLAGFVLFQGAGVGVTSISRPVVTATLLGRESFGAISGAIALFVMATTAVAPSVGAQLWALGGYDLMLAVGGGAAVLALASFLLAVRVRRG